MSGTGAAGFSAAAGIVGTGLNLGINSSINKKTRKWAEKQSELQYKRSLNMMAMQNAYNTPERQVERLKDAGLNVGLMYNQGGGGAGGTSADAAAPQMATWQPNTPDLSSLNLIAQTGLIKAQTAKIKAETDNIGENTTLTTLMQDAQRIDNEINAATSQTQIDQARANLRETIRKIGNIEADTIYKSQETLKSYNDMIWDNMLNEKDLILKECEVKLKEAQTDKEREEINKIKNDVYVSKAMLYEEKKRTNTMIKNAETQESGMLNAGDYNEHMIKYLNNNLKETTEHNKMLEQQGFEKLDIDWEGIISSHLWTYTEDQLTGQGKVRKNQLRNRGWRKDSRIR